MAAREIELQRLVVRLLGDMSSYERMLKNAASITQKGFKQIGDSAVRVGKDLTTKVTLPLVGLGAASVKAFADFDKAMVESTAIMDVTKKQIADMRKVAIDFGSSGETTKGPTELAQAYFFLASAGKDAEQSMKLLPQVAKFATAGNFDMALATDLLTDAQSALGLSSKDAAKDLENMTRVADVLVKANTIANASVQQFSESLTNEAGATFKVFNKDIEEGVAVLAAYADQGIKGQVAGSQLSRVTRLLSKAALDNAKAHKELGFEVFDNSGKMRNYADIIKNIEDITRGMSDEVRAATLDQLGFQARVQGAILPLLGQSEAIRNYEQRLKEAGGTVNAVSKNQMESFSNQMTVMRSQMMAMGIEIGQQLIPHVNTFMGWIRKGVDWFKSLNKEQQENVLKYALIAGAIGPLLVVFGTMMKTISLVIGSFKTLGVALTAGATAMKLTGAAAVVAKGGIAILLAEVTLLAKVMWDLYAANKKFNDELKRGKEIAKKSDEARKGAILKEAERNVGPQKVDVINKQLSVLEKDIKATQAFMKRQKEFLDSFAFDGLLSPFQFKEAAFEQGDARRRLKKMEETREQLMKMRNNALNPAVKVEKDPNADMNAKNHDASRKALEKMAQGTTAIIMTVQPGV